MDKRLNERASLSNNREIKENKVVAIGEMVDSIKRALIETQGDIESSGIKIKRIEITIKSIALEKAGAGVTLQIPLLGAFKIGSDISSKSVQTTSLTLKNPKLPKKSISGLYKPDQKLAESILSLTEGINAAAGNQTPLKLMNHRWG